MSFFLVLLRCCKSTARAAAAMSVWWSGHVQRAKHANLLLWGAIAMSKRKNDGKTYTDEGGKFAQGNPGRPKGARHKITRAVEELLDGEGEAITRKAVDMALDGDTTALRLCLERISPPRKDTPVQFALPPVETAQDASRAAQAVLAAVSAGDLTPLEGASVMGLVEGYRKTLETEDLERRLTALETTK